MLSTKERQELLAYAEHNQSKSIKFEKQMQQKFVESHDIFFELGHDITDNAAAKILANYAWATDKGENGNWETMAYISPKTGLMLSSTDYTRDSILEQAQKRDELLKTSIYHRAHKSALKKIANDDDQIEQNNIDGFISRLPDTKTPNQVLGALWAFANFLESDFVQYDRSRLDAKKVADHLTDLGYTTENISEPATFKDKIQNTAAYVLRAINRSEPYFDMEKFKEMAENVYA